MFTSPAATGTRTNGFQQPVCLDRQVVVVHCGKGLGGASKKRKKNSKKGNRGRWEENGKYKGHGEREKKVGCNLI